LCLDGPRRPALRELQQEAPIARAPPEQRHAAAARRVPKVVLALRDARQEG
jgi:hypothetical protein